jgi:class 3 adenylate cyclase/pimeloyl-ACP methyl ester carboxylesterase
MAPEIRYARCGELNIAYQVVGEGELDLVYVGGWVSSIQGSAEEPTIAHFFERLASFSRLILFDKRGTGLSDPIPLDRLPTLEERMDDIQAVMEAAGSRRAALFGTSEGGPLCALFAATNPDRCSHLVMYGSYAKRLWDADYPWAPTAHERELWYAQLAEEWEIGADISNRAPSADDAVRRWWSRHHQLSASPAQAIALGKMNTNIDIRSALPAIGVPALILHRVDDQDCVVGNGEYLAKHIPGAKYVPLSGSDHIPFFGDSDAILDEVEEFLTGIRPAPVPDRVLATVLFTDIVGATERAVELGDRRWLELLTRHNDTVRQALARFRGVEIDTAGDGFLATFDGPARAVRCANAIVKSVRELGLDVRAGIHTGECELDGAKVRGIAVHTAARIQSLAAAGEVLVSQTVRDLVAGSGLEFEDRGAHELKGVPDEWRVYAAV